MSDSDDRVIHGRTPYGEEIVRYDRAGKWYVEKPGVARRQVSLVQAVRHATKPGSVVYLGRPGGRTFDSRVQQMREAP
jgi:hypothetical protein